MDEQKHPEILKTKKNKIMIGQISPEFQIKDNFTTIKIITK